MDKFNFNLIALRRNVVPGFNLMMAVRPMPGWPEGWLGLVQNEGTGGLIIQGPIQIDPSIGRTGPELERIKKSMAYTDFLKSVQGFRDCKMSPQDGYLLVQACIQKGYRLGIDDFHEWLNNYLATKLAI